MVYRNPELYQKYRPQTLDELVGREQLVNYVKAHLGDPDYNRDAMMFVGESGTGKTTAARIIGGLYVKHENDYVELPGARIGAVDIIRDEIAGQVRTYPWGGPNAWKVFVIDEAQGMSQPAKEAFLDLIENSPERRLFIFTATRTAEGKIPFSKALTSRFKVFPFAPLPPTAVATMLHRISAGEGWGEIPADVLQTIIVEARGNLRNAVQMLERRRFETTVAPPQAVMEAFRRFKADFETKPPEKQRTEILRTCTVLWKRFNDELVRSGPAPSSVYGEIIQGFEALARALEVQ